MNLLDTILDQKIAEGEARGRRGALRAMLVARFGTIPPALEERITNTDLETLSDMISRAAVASTIDEV